MLLPGEESVLQNTPALSLQGGKGHNVAVFCCIYEPIHQGDVQCVWGACKCKLSLWIITPILGLSQLLKI